MELKDVLAVVLSSLALLLAIYSALVARRSADSAKRALRVTANQFASDMALKATQVFIEHPELRPYFFEGQPPPPRSSDPSTERTRYLVDAATELNLDVMELVWDHRSELGRDDVDAWREWMHGQFQTSPALQAQYASSRGYPSLRKMLAIRDCSKKDEHTWAAQHRGG